MTDAGVAWLMELIQREAPAAAPGARERRERGGPKGKGRRAAQSRQKSMLKLS